MTAPPHPYGRDNPLGGYDVTEQVGFLLRRANQRHAAIFQERMAAWELTPTQFTALVRVVEFGRLTQNRLGRLTAMDPATIQGVVRRLADRALIERLPDPQDRRTRVLAATSAGLDMAAAAVQAARNVTQATLAPMPAPERQHFLRLLAQVA